MAFKISFLGAKKPLSKTISPTETSAYPLVKNFTSESYLISSLNDLYLRIKAAAEKSQCLVKGMLTQELNNEPRSRKTIPTQKTDWICVDIDGLIMPTPTKNISARDFELLAERVIARLPAVLANTSYIAQASNSFGIKENSLSMHFFFLLDSPISPIELKKWFTVSNFTTKEFCDNLQLTKTGWDVKYTLDRCLADNSRLIYIAPPVLKGIPDPFEKTENRITLVKKSEKYINSKLLLESATVDIEKTKQIKIRELRKAAGLSAIGKAKYTTLHIDGKETSILTNPTPGTLIPSYSGRGFEYYNKDNGNSNAYYHPTGKPAFIYNFKDEPIFRWSDIDRAAYDDYVALNKAEIEKANPIDILAVINIHDDLMYKITVNRETNDIRLSPSSPTMVGHFYREHGEIVPETINEWDIRFDPKSNMLIDYDTKIINSYKRSEPLKEAELANPKDPQISDIKTQCPAIHNVLMHILGNGAEEYDHYINWLAYIIQEKEKTNTCWFLSGVQGTGKGLFFNKVLKPLFGMDNVGFHLGTAIEDGFDAWRENKQLVVIDEFELPTGKAGDKLLERIKNWVAEEDTSVRAMRQVARNIHSIEAYMFFSNKHSMVKVDLGDRRFNIAPRQERRITTTNFFDPHTIVAELGSELQTFANLLVSMPTDAIRARTPLENSAKKIASDATKTEGATLVEAIINGDSDYFINVLYCEVEDAGDNMTLQTDIMHARNVVKSFMPDINRATSARPAKIKVAPREMGFIYKTLCLNTSITTTSMNKMLQRAGITPKYTSLNGKKGKYFTLTLKPSATLSKKEMDILSVSTLSGTVIGLTAN